MPGPVLHLGAVMMCSHGGPGMPSAPFPRVLVSGQPVATIAAPWIITGCALTTSSGPFCATGMFTTGAMRVLAGGQPLALLTGTSTCVATGSPMLPVTAQPRVIAT